jgi:hypothetical protein
VSKPNVRKNEARIRNKPESGVKTVKSSVEQFA